MANKFYLTTAIPYVNARPHAGHALEYVIADVVHRYHELKGDDTFFVSGADENAIKNVQAAEKEGLEPALFLDKYSKIFKDFYKLLEVDLDEYRRGTDQEKHWPGVQELWKLVDKNGDIFKKKYKGLYCIGCESFKTEKELVDGKCPDHERIPEEVEEENYFFKLSRYQEFLRDLISEDKLKIYPEKRKNEILSFIDQGLEDFSISRSNKRARNIGVPVPGDDTQKMFVWFDALAIYMTAVGWGYDKALWGKWWPANLHIIGKDIIRFHAVYWPAMLRSANLPLPKEILVHGFITAGGRKMSKSIGNVIDPYEVIEKYGVEALRYFLLSQIPTLDDGDFTYEKFEKIHNADLANGLGNLVARVAKLCEEAGAAGVDNFKENFDLINADIASFRFDSALDKIWQQIKFLDRRINNDEPWKIKDKKQLKNKLYEYSYEILNISQLLKPFLPKTAQSIFEQFSAKKIISQAPLFPRL